jgi:hypothetical protein
VAIASAAEPGEAGRHLVAQHLGDQERQLQ